jgi:hypothetical protein
MFTTALMMAYNRGVLTDEFLHCSDTTKEVNHGVVLVGYGTVDSNTNLYGHCKEYWIIRNSWGARWGEDGFFKLCADESPERLGGTCLVNQFAAWPLYDI